jgi:fatty-acyl-CoA synthase
VIGLPDPKWGAVVTAVVVKADPNLTAEKIDEFCKGSKDLASFKRPRRIIFVDELPINASGKVVKRELLARCSMEAA